MPKIPPTMVKDLGTGKSQTTINSEKLDKAGDTMTGNLNVPSINSGQLGGFRNKIINGKMEVAQRGTNFPAIAGQTYSLDRWRTNTLTTSAVLTVSQQADAPSSNEFQSSLRVTVTTADTNIAAADTAAIVQVIEGYNIRDLVGRTFTLSFWVRSSKTGIHCISFSNSASDRSYVAEYIVLSANTWEYKTVTVSGGLPTTGTWDYTTGVGLPVRFILASGSGSHTTPDSWKTGSFAATANQVNCLDTVGNIFALTGVQLEVGSQATPFEHRHYGLELQLCQRYYTAGDAFGLYATTSGNSWGMFEWLPVTMRTVPTVTNGTITSNIGTTAFTTVPYVNKIRWVITSSATGTGSVNFTYTAYAEL